MKRTQPAPLSVWRTLNLDDFLLGAPHYPKHVDESYWVRDAQRMAAAGFNVVRLGEFAWHIMEPREGHFDFSLFDKAIAVLAAEGIKTIFCTPTATPPRWLTATYPEVLRVDERGRTASHGSRQHADTNSPVYRMHSRRITQALADHFKDNPHVVGWQTDNELNTTASTSYSEATEREFQRWLRDRYETIDALNFAWGGHFWALAYDGFDQVPLPRRDNPGFPAPAHMQDYHRFLAHATAAFQHDQVEISDRPIGTGLSSTISGVWKMSISAASSDRISISWASTSIRCYTMKCIEPVATRRSRHCSLISAAPIRAISSCRSRPPA